MVIVDMLKLWLKLNLSICSANIYSKCWHINFIFYDYNCKNNWGYWPPTMEEIQCAFCKENNVFEVTPP